MRRKLVVGNWKMHGSRTQVRQLIEGVAIGSVGLKKVEIAVAPTLLHIGLAAELCASEDAGHLKLAAQNLLAEPAGARKYSFTTPAGSAHVGNYHKGRSARRRDDDFPKHFSYAMQCSGIF